MRLFRRKIRGKLSEIWTAELKIPGQNPITRSTRETSKEIARAKAERWQAELNQKRLKKINNPDWVDPDAFDLVERLADWSRHLDQLGRTKKHINDSTRHAILFFDMAQTESPFDLTENVIRQCLGRMDCAPRTKKNRLLGLTAFFNYLRRAGHWTKPNPTMNVEIGHVPKTRQRRALTAQEIKDLIAAAPKYRKLAYMMALFTGLRRNELYQLKWGDICFDTKTITLRPTITKNRKADVLPLAELLIEPLLEWRDTGYQNQKLGARGRSVEALRKRHNEGYAVPALPRVTTLRVDLRNAGIELKNDHGLIDFHSLRYTFGSQLVSRGVGIEAVSRLMRHANITQTAGTYIVHGIEERRKNLDALSDLLD